MTQDIITVEQFRMAKAALRWTNAELAEKSKLHKNTINRLENGLGKESNLMLLKSVFEHGGIEFIPENGGGAGVRLK